jgi:uncharacterized protein
MRIITRRKQTVALLWIGILILTVGMLSCRGTTRPVHFYTLNALSPESPVSGSSTSKRDMAIGVAPLSLPKAMDRPQIVIRTGANTIRVSEFHRWAGELGRDMLNVIVDNLSLLMKTDRVAGYPWERYFEPDYRIYIDVRAFDYHLGESVMLKASWVITGMEFEALSNGRKVFTAEVAGEGYDDLVAAASRAVSLLSVEIASDLSALTPAE